MPSSPPREALFADLPAGAVLVSSPAHLSRVGGLPPLTGAARPRMVLTAGAPLPAEAAAEAAAVFGTFPTEIYGSTESGAIRFGQQVRVTAMLVEFEHRIRVDYVIADAATGRILTKARTTQVAVVADTQELCLESPAAFVDKVRRLLP